MNLQNALQDYLTLRRSLGFKYKIEGIYLQSFVSFMEQNQRDFISSDWALSWAKKSKSTRVEQWACRLSAVRGFARYCKAVDSRSEIPSIDLLPYKKQRPTPYFLSDNHIKQLLQATQQLSLRGSFLRRTLNCYLGLLSVSGIRASEALNLNLDDVDLQSGVLTVRNAKLGKSRLIPLHSTTIDALQDYRGHRERFLTGRQCPYWFVNQQGKRLRYDCVTYYFRKLLKATDLDNQSRYRRPHLHDVRHYFALSTLTQWYYDGQDVERRLPVLSAYLGHVETRDTYWYLSAHPELMNAALARLEKHWEKIS